MTWSLFPHRLALYLLTVQYRHGTTIELPSPRFAARAGLTEIDASRSTHSCPLITYTVRVTRHARREIGDSLKHSHDVAKVRWAKATG